MRVVLTNQKKISVSEEHMRASDKRQEEMSLRLDDHAKETRQDLHTIRDDIKTMLQRDH